MQPFHSLFVTLDKSDEAWANQEAHKRKSENTKLGYKSLTKDASLQWEIMGTRGERAFSIATGILVSEDRYAKDCGIFQIRTRDKSYYDLPFRKNSHDLESDPWVLILSHAYPIMELAGWAYGHEVVKRGKLIKGVGAGLDFYVLPKKDLHPMIDLFLLGDFWPTARASFDSEIERSKLLNHDNNRPKKLLGVQASGDQEATRRASGFRHSASVASVQGNLFDV